MLPKTPKPITLYFKQHKKHTTRQEAKAPGHPFPPPIPPHVGVLFGLQASIFFAIPKILLKDSFLWERGGKRSRAESREESFAYSVERGIALFKISHSDSLV